MSIPDPQRWQHIKSLLDSALELEAAGREEFLTQVCAGDEELRQRIESLIDAHERAGDFIESPAFELLADSLTDQKESLVGRSFGPYHVISAIGSGGMGEVYLAQDPRLGRKIALKVLPAPYTADLDRVGRFRQEARSASALNHPSIITIFEIGEIDSRHFIVTEFIDGETLRRKLAQAQLTIPETLRIAAHIASALAAAHAGGIVHRDIKPENIMLRDDGIVKVLDFGLAKLTDRKTEQTVDITRIETEPGIVMGTSFYMSPEQARGLTVDARTDIWSLGVVLYEMVAGQVPFKGDTSSDVIASILSNKPIPLTRYAAQVPPELEWIVEKTLRKDREERYQTAKELFTDLRSLRRKLEYVEDRHSDDGRSGEVARRPEFDSYDPAKPQSGSYVRNIIDSLAILPLVNTSADSSMDYFSDGISESMINSLSQVSELRVMAWSTVSRYRGRKVDPRDAAHDLGVRAVLTGRIMQLGEHLVIKTELVDARDGSHLWGESYSCRPSEILDIQAEIAGHISEKLLLRLTTEERKRITKRYTENVAAYHAYLRGRYCWNKRTDESVRKAIAHFKQAIDIDPSYALAHSGLADCYLILGAFGISTMSPHDAFPKAREAALSALDIDETLAEAHATLAYVLGNYDWNLPAADKEFKRSFELKPGYAAAHHWYGFTYLTALGRVDDAIAEARRALELDPLSLPVSSNIGFLLYLARRHDEAIVQFQKTIEMDQNFVYSHWQMALALEQQRRYEEAIAEFQKAITLSGRSTLPVALLGHAYAVSGQEAQALATLDQLNELSSQRFVPPYRVAAIYAGLGNNDLAFQWLDRALEARDGWLVWFTLDPVMEVLSTDLRFERLARRIGFRSEAQNEVYESTRILPGNAGTSSQSITRSGSPRQPITSLAILPLVNTVDDPELDYFSDGITESIINTLSQFPKLRVVARSTVFRYKNALINPEEVGRLLDVQAILTGRVRQIGDRLIVSTELIDVANDSQLWGEHYNRNLTDVFQVQEEIAREIASKLRLELNPEEKARFGIRYTDNVDAYRAYLKGRYHWNKRTIESLKKGVDYFKQAIDHDPAYASAYAGLSDSYTLLVVREAMSPDEGFAKAKAAASMALKIDESFAEAHASLGHAMLHNWEWADGERELKRAIELNPGYASAHHWYSEHLTAMGRCDESITQLKLAGRLDPLSLIISADLGRAFYYAREYDEVMKQEAITLEMDPNFWLSHINVGRSYTQMGKHEDAINQLEKVVQLSVSNTEALSFLGFAYAAAGLREEALSTLDRLKEQSRRGHVPPYHFAIMHAGLGENDQAFDWLEKAFEKHAVDLFTLKVEPMFDSLRTDERFEALLNRVGLSSPPAYKKQASVVGNESSIETKLLAEAGPESVAVLPFRPMSNEGRDEILELGIADALITKLSDLSQLIVRPTSVVRRYIDLEQDSLIAGREMAVDSVLEGSIQRLGDRIRITARLVRVADGRSLWTGKFDQEFTDIFAVEDSISERVTAALALKLTRDEKTRLKKRHTKDPAAHRLYLAGRYYWNKRTEEALHKSIQYFERAIDIDANYALAYAGVADCYTKLGDTGVTATLPKQAFARARVAALKALQIDGSLADVHAALGHIDIHELRWADAENDLKRAIELNPNYATAHHWYAYLNVFHRRFSEAFEGIRVAGDLDPLSLPIADSVGEFLYFARRTDESIKQFGKVLEMDPNFLASRISLGRAYEQKGMFNQAEEQFLKARQMTEESIDALANLGHTYAVSGRTDAALGVLGQLNSLSQKRYVSPYDIGLIHTALGETGKAFRWFDKAYNDRVEWLVYMNVDPRLDPLRSDSRFHDLIQKIGFAPGASF